MNLCNIDTIQQNLSGLFLDTVDLTEVCLKVQNIGIMPLLGSQVMCSVASQWCEVGRKNRTLFVKKCFWYWVPLGCFTRCQYMHNRMYRKQPPNGVNRYTFSYCRLFFFPVCFCTIAQYRQRMLYKNIHVSASRLVQQYRYILICIGCVVRTSSELS